MKLTFSAIKLFILAISGLFLFSACEKDQILAPMPQNRIDDNGSFAPKPPKGTFFYGLSSNNELIGFQSGNPLQEEGTVSISGLQSGETILAIDFRPATGQLYGVSNMSRIYIINTASGVARPVSMTPFTPAINGTLVGFDFNPTVDRIRLVTNNEQNIRIHPETGMVAAVDGSLNPGDRTVVAVAYTNSFAGSTSTTLYDIDVSDDKLYKQVPPNAGTLQLVGSLGVLATGEGGFDISPDNSVAIAVLFGRGDDDEDDQDEISNGNKTKFYYINLETGEATNAGKTERAIIGLAIPTNPVAYAVDLSNKLVIFNPEQPGSLYKRTFTGLQVDEVVLGIDMRPATSQLFALGSSSRVYSVNMASGAATAIGATSFTPALSGTSFGFDFNPTVDRIRIVSNTGQNLRVHPVTGAVAFVDGSLNPGTPTVDAVAYINNFAGATVTELYDIDYTSDKLFSQTPPNSGTLIEGMPLGVNIDAGGGFDIGSMSGQAMGIFSTGAQTKIYNVNLDSGAATAISAFPEKVKGFTLGLGF